MSNENAYLVHIKDSIANIERIAAKGRVALFESQDEQAAILWYLQTLSGEAKAKYPEIDWEAIGGFRNRLAHGYLSVNLKIVWSIIEDYLPPLKDAINTMLVSVEQSGDEDD